MTNYLMTRGQNYIVTTYQDIDKGYSKAQIIYVIKPLTEYLTSFRYFGPVLRCLGCHSETGIQKFDCFQHSGI